MINIETIDTEETIETSEIPSETQSQLPEVTPCTPIINSRQNERWSSLVTSFRNILAASFIAATVNSATDTNTTFARAVPIESQLMTSKRPPLEYRGPNKSAYSYAGTDGETLIAEIDEVQAAADSIRPDDIFTSFLISAENDAGYNLVEFSDLPEVTISDKLAGEYAGNVLPAVFRSLRKPKELLVGTIVVTGTNQIGPGIYLNTAIGPAHGFEQIYNENKDNPFMPSSIAIGIQDSNGTDKFWPATIELGEGYEEGQIATDQQDTAKIDFLTSYPINTYGEGSVSLTREQLSLNPSLLDLPLYVTGFPTAIKEQDGDQDHEINRIIMKGSVHSVEYGEDGQIATVNIRFVQLDTVVLSLGGMSGGKVSVYDEITGKEIKIGTYRGHKTIGGATGITYGVITPYENSYVKTKIGNPAIPEDITLPEIINTDNIGNFEGVPITIDELSMYIFQNTSAEEFNGAVDLVNLVRALEPAKIVVRNGGFYIEAVIYNGSVKGYEINLDKLALEDPSIG